MKKKESQRTLTPLRREIEKRDMKKIFLPWIIFHLHANQGNNHIHYIDELN